MKKIFLAAAVFCGFAVASSQAQIQVGAHGIYNKLLGDAGEDAPAGFGGGVQARYFVSPKFAVGLGVDYIAHSDEEEFFGVTVKSTATIMPITLNASYFFTEEGFRPYAGLNLGMYSLGGSVEVAGEKEDAETQTKFGLAPMVGAQYMFNEMVGLDLNVRYHYIMNKDEDAGVADNTTAFGVNLGLVFNFGGK